MSFLLRCFLFCLISISAFGGEPIPIDRVVAIVGSR